MHISVNRLDRGFEQYQNEFEQKALEILRGGWYILGKEVEGFEKEFAAFVGAKECVGLGTGLDALCLAVRALGIGVGDEIIVQGNTYIASVMGITINGATPVFVEPDGFFQIDADKIEDKISPRTKAIMIVHLYGQVAQMDKIVEICHRYDLRLIEDCAQSHGAYFAEKMTGNFGDIGCFSFYPSKNLGGFGDGGAIVTNNRQLAEDIRVLGNYGSEKRYYNKTVGINSRLDEMQAGLLRIRLKHIKEITEERQRIADRYMTEIDNPEIKLPLTRSGTSPVWHQYVIRTRNRDKLQIFLKKNSIETIIHYPIPPHLSEAYSYLDFSEGCLPITERYANEVLSIPMYTGLTDKEQKRVIEAINQYGE